MKNAIPIEEILEAQRTIAGKVKRTPLNHSSTFSKMTGCEVYLKHENLQKAGSFKIRGAYNRMAHIPPETRKKGVIAVSTGNHAQGVALAASLFGIPATIVMPNGAPISKITATRGYGGRIVLHGNSFEDAYAKAKELEKSEDLTLIHAYDDRLVIAGAGTVGLEILEDLPDADVVVCPIGGGGLISGIASAVKAKKPDCRVVGVQAANMDAAVRSLKDGRLVVGEKGYTLADGLAIKSPSALTFGLMRELLDDVATVTEEEIAHAILLLLERCKSVSEGAGAVALAALLHGNVAKKGDKVVLVLSGGNIDITMLGKIITQGMAKTGRYVEVKATIEDRPGKLDDLLRMITGMEASVMSINIDRYSPKLLFGHVVVELAVETKGREHSDELVKALRQKYSMLTCE